MAPPKVFRAGSSGAANVHVPPVHVPPVKAPHIDAPPVKAHPEPPKTAPANPKKPVDPTAPKGDAKPKKTEPAKPKDGDGAAKPKDADTGAAKPSSAGGMGGILAMGGMMMLPSALTNIPGMPGSKTGSGSGNLLSDIIGGAGNVASTAILAEKGAEVLNHITDSVTQMVGGITDSPLKIGVIVAVAGVFIFGLPKMK
jgi:hypothetical protein